VSDEAPQPEQAAPVEPDQPADPGAPENEAPEDNANHEAAKWRTKLRETEQQRDQLAGQLEAMRRDQIDGITTGLGIKPAALWASGATVDALLGDTGTVDGAKVQAAVAAARTELGIGTRSTPKRGGLSGALPTPAVARDGWRDAFVPASKKER
jgi:hypothetical protein